MLLPIFHLTIKMSFHKPIKGVFSYVPSTDLSINYLLQFASEHHYKSVKAQTLIIFDEAAIKFNSRDFGNRDRLDWINFFQ